MTRHERIVHIGDVVDTIAQWVVAVVFILTAVLGASVLGVVTLLGILDMIGRR